MKDDNDIVLSVRNVSKCFEMYEKPVHRLYQTLCAGRKKFYKEFWALKDISFDVRRGECVGIIGRNGAGKSTLLQIITGTLAPTTGEVTVKGRVAALLELGSGFNPEFTGRENVYLNGAILGLTRAEIDARFKEIEDFADIGDFIDQPVKTYSSGMMVRLAFAVNAFVNPEILIVDEALAVGDAAFQLKCAKRMRTLLEQNTTVLFVSHDTNALRTYCDRAIWLEQGLVRCVGNVKATTEAFLAYMFSRDGGNAALETGLSRHEIRQGLQPRHWGTGEVVVETIHFAAQNRAVEYGQDLNLHVEIVVKKDFCCKQGLSCVFSIRNTKALDIVCCSSRDEQLYTSNDLVQGEKFAFTFTWRNELAAGKYVLNVAVQNDGDPEHFYCDYVENASIFTVIEPYKIYALTRPKCKTEMKRGADGKGA